MGIEADKSTIDLDMALQRLRYISPRQSQIMEIHDVGGMADKEIAAVLSLSEVTIHKDMKVAKI